MNASDVVLGSVLVIVTSTLVRIKRAPIRGQTFTPFQVIAFGFLLATGLLIVAIASPGLAKGLAYLGLVGAFVVNGPTLFGLLGNLGRDDKASAGARGGGRNLAA